MSAPSRTYMEKVVLYVTHGGQLLVFREPQFPEILLQVPGGTVEPGEAIDAAARRELAEETGIRAIATLTPLGQQPYIFDAFGVSQHHQRHYFHVTLPEGATPAERWTNMEVASSLGHGPIAFDLFWIDLERAARELGYGFTHKLTALQAILNGGDIGCQM